MKSHIYFVVTNVLITFNFKIVINHIYCSKWQNNSFMYMHYIYHNTVHKRLLVLAMFVFLSFFMSFIE